CTSPHCRARGHVTPVEEILGDRLLGTYELVQPHVPDFQVADATVLAADLQIDAVIGLGGGSSVGMAKAVSRALEERLTGLSAHTAAPIDQPLIPVVAIPTTYAGSEMTPVYGVTHHTGGTARKITSSSPKSVPRLTIYDPLRTLYLPQRLTAGTGINAV